VGSQVPLSGPDGKGVNYRDIGLNIDVNQVTEVDGRVVGSIGLETSSVAPPEAGAAPSGPPVLRHLRLRMPFSVVPGKLTTVGTVDDVNSRRKFQVEITATRQ
jgi:hypothetical protein